MTHIESLEFLSKIMISLAEFLEKYPNADLNRVFVYGVLHYSTLSKIAVAEHKFEYKTIDEIVEGMFVADYKGDKDLIKSRLHVRSCDYEPPMIENIQFYQVRYSVEFTNLSAAEYIEFLARAGLRIKKSTDLNDGDAYENTKRFFKQFHKIGVLGT